MGCVGSHPERSDVFPIIPLTPHTPEPHAFVGYFGRPDDAPCSETTACKPIPSTTDINQLRTSSEGSSIVSGLGTADLMTGGGRHDRIHSTSVGSTFITGKQHSLAPAAANLFVRSSSSSAAGRSVSALMSPGKGAGGGGGGGGGGAGEPPAAGTMLLLPSGGDCAASPAPQLEDGEAQTEGFRLEVREVGPTMPVRWKKGESIGSGSFGTVYLGLNSRTGELLAVKEVAVLDGGRSTEAVEQLEREVNLLSSLNHPNIVRYVGTVREASSLFIFLEYVPGGSIASLLSRFGPLDELVIRIYTRQLLSGLAYLHAQRTVHRDVKGANLLVEKNGRVKLADFGMAKQMVEQVSFTKSFKGSAFWMAPEVIKQQGHGTPADIWSIGCTVLEMATGKPPWAQCSTQVQAIFRIASSTDLPAIPDSLSPEASEFILLCLQRDPNARPSAEQLLQHAFVSMCVDDVPALAGPTVDWVSASATTASRGCVLTHVDAPELPGSLNSSLAKSRFDAPRRATKLMDSAMLAARGGLGKGSGNGGLPSSSRGAAAADEEPEESLASLVLGTSLHLGKHKSRTDLNSSLRDGGGSGRAGGANSNLGSGSWRGGGGTAGAGGSGLGGRDAATGAGIAEEDDDTVDFTTQPRQFKVRGLLSLPPLHMLQGQQLPAVRCHSLLASASSSPLRY